MSEMASPGSKFSSNPAYEVITVDFVGALAQYIFTRCHSYANLFMAQQPPLDHPGLQADGSAVVHVLELGAGDGRLAYFLQQRLDIMCLRHNAEVGQGGSRSGRGKMQIRYFACDDTSFGIRPSFTTVEKCPHTEALAKIASSCSVSKATAATVTTSSSKTPAAPPEPPTSTPSTSATSVASAPPLDSPVLVLTAWMPGGVDWTREIRACSAVQEYLLIGESDSNVCGDKHLTWWLDDDDGNSNDNDDGAGAGTDGGAGGGKVNGSTSSSRRSSSRSFSSGEEDLSLGFERVEIDRIHRKIDTDGGGNFHASPLGTTQVCRSDSNAACGFSRCISFRRLGPGPQAETKAGK